MSSREEGLATTVKEARAKLLAHLPVLFNGGDAATQGSSKRDAASDKKDAATVTASMKDLMDRISRGSVSVERVLQLQKMLDEHMSKWRERNAAAFCTFVLLFDNYLWLNVAVKDSDPGVSSPGAATRRHRQTHYLVEISQRVFVDLTDWLRASRGEGSAGILASFRDAFFPFWVKLLERAEPHPLNPARKAHIVARIRDTVVASDRIKRNLPSLLEPSRLGTFLADSTELVASLDLLEVIHYRAKAVPQEQQLGVYDTFFASLLQQQQQQQATSQNDTERTLVRQFSQMMSTATSATFDTFCEQIIAKLGELQLSRPQMFACPVEPTTARAPNWFVPREIQSGSRLFHVWITSTRLSIDVKDAYEIERLLHARTDRGEDWAAEVAKIESIDCIVAFDDIDDISVDGLTGACDIVTKRPIHVQVGNDKRQKKTLGNKLSLKLDSSGLARLPEVLDHRSLAFRWRGGLSEKPIALNEPHREVDPPHDDIGGKATDVEPEQISKATASSSPPSEDQHKEDGGYQGRAAAARQSLSRDPSGAVTLLECESESGLRETAEDQGHDDDAASDFMEQYIEFDGDGSGSRVANHSEGPAEPQSPSVRRTSVEGGGNGSAARNIAKLGSHTLVKPLRRSHQRSGSSSSPPSSNGVTDAITGLRRSSRLIERQMSSRQSSPPLAVTVEQKATLLPSLGGRAAKRTLIEAEDTSAEDSGSEYEATTSLRLTNRQRASNGGGGQGKGAKRSARARAGAVARRASPTAASPSSVRKARAPPKASTSTSVRTKERVRPAATKAAAEQTTSRADSDVNLNSEPAEKHPTKGKQRSGAAAAASSSPGRIQISAAAVGATQSPKPGDGDVGIKVRGGLATASAGKDGAAELSTGVQLAKPRDNSPLRDQQQALAGDWTTPDPTSPRDKSENERVADEARHSKEGTVAAHKREREARGIRRLSGSASGPKSDEAPWMTDRHRRSIARQSRGEVAQGATSPVDHGEQAERRRRGETAGEEAGEEVGAEVGEGEHQGSPVTFEAPAASDFSDDLEYVDNTATGYAATHGDVTQISTEAAELMTEPEPVAEPENTAKEGGKPADISPAHHSPPSALKVCSKREPEAKEQQTRSLDQSDAEGEAALCGDERSSARRVPTSPRLGRSGKGQVQGGDGCRYSQELPHDSLQAAQLASAEQGNEIRRTPPPVRPPVNVAMASRSTEDDEDSDVIEFYEFRAFQERKRKARVSWAASRAVGPSIFSKRYVASPAAATAAAARVNSSPFTEHTSPEFRKPIQEWKPARPKALNPQSQGSMKWTSPLRRNVEELGGGRPGPVGSSSVSLKSPGAGRADSPDNEAAARSSQSSGPTDGIAKAANEHSALFGAYRDEVARGPSDPRTSEALQIVEHGAAQILEILNESLQGKVSGPADLFRKTYCQMFLETSTSMQDSHDENITASDVIRGIVESLKGVTDAFPSALSIEGSSGDGVPKDGHVTSNLLSSLNGRAMERGQRLRDQTLPDRLGL